MSDGPVARLKRLAAEAQRANRLPSLVLASARQGSQVATAAIGVTDYGHTSDDTATQQPHELDAGGGTGRVPGPDTPYRIGSITKTFTAALVLSLAEREVLALNAPVSTYLPDTPFGDVPVRALLAHHAGLPREVPGDMWTAMRGPSDVEFRAALGEVAMADTPLTRWHYSNLGYSVLGVIVEHQTGTSCTQLITETLLRPLNLSGTSWTRPANAAVGYRVAPYTDLVHREPDMEQGAVAVAGQLWSTASDLLRWGDALVGGAPGVMSPDVVDAMHTPQVMVDPIHWTRGWGLGLILDRRGDRVFAGHTGAMPGFFAALSTDRASRTVTVALTNATQSTALGPLATDVTEFLASTPDPEPTPWTPAGPVPHELEQVLGPWWSESAETVFTWRADGLHAHLVENPAGTDTRFISTDKDVYRAVEGRMRGEWLYLRRDHDCQVTELEWATYPYTRAPR